MTTHFPRSGLGREYVSSPAATTVRPGWVPPFDPHSREQWGRCTRQELRILELIARGHSSKQIGELLGGILKTTIDSHRSHLIHKVGARNIAHAVALAYQDGVLSTGPQLPVVMVGGVQYEPRKRLAA